MTQDVTTPAELKDALANGPTQFSFQKKDGTLRSALGTTNISHIPQGKQPVNSAAPTPGVVPFFDLQKEEWRSVSESSLIFS